MICYQHPVELPGRGARSGAPLITDYRTLIVTLTREIADEITRLRQTEGNVKYAAFGHGAGAVLALGVCSRLAQRLQQPPVHCFLSAGLPPHVERKKRSVLSDDDLVGEMHTTSWTKTHEMADLFLPIFRADCAIDEQAAQDKDMRLNCPFTLFAGEQDASITPDLMWSWSLYTTCGARNVMLRGDHLSVLHAPQDMLGYIRDDLDRSQVRKIAFGV